MSNLFTHSEIREDQFKIFLIVLERDDRVTGFNKKLATPIFLLFHHQLSSYSLYRLLLVYQGLSLTAL